MALYSRRQKSSTNILVQTMFHMLWLCNTVCEYYHLSRWGCLNFQGQTWCGKDKAKIHRQVWRTVVTQTSGRGIGDDAWSRLIGTVNRNWNCKSAWMAFIRDMISCAPGEAWNYFGLGPTGPGLTPFLSRSYPFGWPPFSNPACTPWPHSLHTIFNASNRKLCAW
jgi:hypothetical protein